MRYFALVALLVLSTCIASPAQTAGTTGGTSSGSTATTTSSATASWTDPSYATINWKCDGDGRTLNQDGTCKGCGDKLKFGCVEHKLACTKQHKCGICKNLYVQIQQ